DCDPSQVISPTADPSLPPVPPRSTPNCPPQCFSSPLSPSSAAQTPVSPKLDRHAVKTPTVGVVPKGPPPIPHRLPAHSPRTHSGARGMLCLHEDIFQDEAGSDLLLYPEFEKHSDSQERSRGTQRMYVIGRLLGIFTQPSSTAVSEDSSPAPQTSVDLTCDPLSPSPSHIKTVADDIQKDQTPQVPPRIRTPQTLEDAHQSAQPVAQPVLPARRAPQPPCESRLDSLNESSDEYEDPDFFNPGVNRMTGFQRDMSLQVPGHVKAKRSSWFSDDEQLDDDEISSTWQDGGIGSLQESVYLPKTGRLSSASKDDSSQLVAVIKMGWLDKNPPQGALYYQRRWVKLDVDYLRYFDNEKEVYSKGIISTAFITNVSSVGELKFEVVTNNRTFIFRAESEGERNDWVAALQDCTRGRPLRTTMIPGSPPALDFQGNLELRGLRSKLYTVVAIDKVFLYKNIEDYRIGVGITSIEMNVGNIKETDRRGFDLTTPYRIFSFIAESEQLREQWVDSMRDAIGEALSNSEVADRIWEEPSNSLCADCEAPKPEWAAINLCVVVCKRCAGEHRGLGPSISKVRSLKMDRKVWTEELIKVFLLLGNERVNSFWAANIPPSEALVPSSCSEERRRFITNKYRQGKYRKYHPLYGNQKELNNEVRVYYVQFVAKYNQVRPLLSSLATTHTQPLQAELISHNLNTELPRSEPGGGMDTRHYLPAPCVSHNGFLFKTASMARAITERKAKEVQSVAGCTLNDGTYSYYESDKNSNPNGALKASEIVWYEHTFELYSESERLYLFGTDDPDGHKEWVKSIARSLIPASAEPLLRLAFERIGRLKCKDGLNLHTSKVGWFALVGSTLHAYLEDSQGEEIHLRKLNELSIQQDNEVLVLVERGRTLYIEGERKLDFAGWCTAIQAAAGSGGDTLSQQQLTETDIPVIVHSCIGYITQCGLTSEGIYRKSGVNSRVAALCERFHRDARSVRLREGEHQVDDVSTTLKRFFRDLEEGLFTSEESKGWLSAAGIQEESQKISQFQLLVKRLPRVNKATLQALINHLFCVRPHTFQTDGKDYTAGRAVEDLIQHYTLIFEVDEQQLKKQLEEITVIIKVRETLNTKFPSTEPGGHFICTVSLVRVTAAELTCEVLDRRNIGLKTKSTGNCWENAHCTIRSECYPSFTPWHRLPSAHQETPGYGGDDGVPGQQSGFIQTRDMKFREEAKHLGLGLSSGSFHDRYFILNSSSLRMYKEVRSNRPERDWVVKSLKVYLGIKKKLRPPTCWGLTVVCESKKQEKQEKQQWYLCCDTQTEMREWYATLLSIQYDGNVWPQDGLQQTRVSRVLPDTRHGNVSLIPLRGSENEMRNSVAAFSQDPLALFRDVR
ncbi:hypothetical protein KUCAC02_005843, partial [Chaenocephalus aceratus]